MLASKEDIDFSLQKHSERVYKTEVERAFFGAIENQKPATSELVSVYANIKREGLGGLSRAP